MWEFCVKSAHRRQDLAGAGLLLDDLLGEAGYDPQKVQGFAFGFGLEPIVLWRMNLDDIRKLWQPPYVPE